MSDFNKKILANLERLCRIKCEPEEEEQILQNLQKILTYVEMLDELQITTCEQPHLLLNEKTDLREDEVKETLSSNLFLSNAPDQIGGMVKVPQVIENQE